MAVETRLSVLIWFALPMEITDAPMHESFTPGWAAMVCAMAESMSAMSFAFSDVSLTGNLDETETSASFPDLSKM